MRSEHRRYTPIYIKGLINEEVSITAVVANYNTCESVR
jgi:hypothetical protein